MTDTMGRMHLDAQFADSSSVPAHVEMMGFLGVQTILLHLHKLIIKKMIDFIC